MVYMNTTSIVIPRNILKRVDDHRKHLGISKRDYVMRAVDRFMRTSSADFYTENGFDADFAEELAEWERVSLEDFARFSNEHNL